MTFSCTEILKRIEKNVLMSYRKKTGYDKFHNRLELHFPLLFEHMVKLYGKRSDFLYQIEDIIKTSCKFFLARENYKNDQENIKAGSLRSGSQNELGAMFYVDLFAGKLNDIRKRIPYLKDLGVTFIHLMPVFKTPSGKTDGGYAVSSYRFVDKRFGNIDDLRTLADILKQNGMKLVLDFILNHTSDQHEWAVKAKSGDLKYQGYYYLFEKQEELEEYSPYLRDIFPEARSGSFTFNTDLQKFVWTTFNNYQWDLNYGNPAVFLQMMKEMLFLSELGVEVLRFDAPAFIWKKKGTSCENLPEVHILIKAFRSIMNIAAPEVLFLSEAIVHPDEIKKYISKNECELSYNPLLMATLWESLATRKTSLLQKSMEGYASLPEDCYWINYIRCHDDIGWTFSDQDARDVGIDPYGHRIFLNQFYTGRFEGSFAVGLPFQENLLNGDLRISGTLASLAGLEKALNVETEAELNLAVCRILLLYGIILSMNGYPLIYIGDEAGQLNNYSYAESSELQDDSRWVHRQPFVFPDKNKNHYTRRLFDELKKLIQLRKITAAFAGNAIKILNLKNDNVFGFIRGNEESPGKKKITVLSNFSEKKQTINMPGPFKDTITGTNLMDNIELDSYQILWLREIET